MTNLIEKSLLLGFGIFTITIFSTILIPFLGKIAVFNQNEYGSLESYTILINEVDIGITNVVQHPNEPFLRVIDYPDNLNITFYDNFAKYEFILEEKIYVKFYEYNTSFINRYFYQIPVQTYLLNISRQLTLTSVNFINLH